LVERIERCRAPTSAGISSDETIELRFQLVGAAGRGASGSFGANYTRYGARERIKLTTATPGMPGAVALNLPGLEGNRIGTYLMNVLVTWAQQWPNADVAPIELTSAQAGEDNKARRNRFYEQFNLEFVYSDNEHRAGKSKPMMAAGLCTVETWRQNLLEVPLAEFLNDVLVKTDLQELEIQRLKVALANAKMSLQDAEARPVRFALQRTWWAISAAIPVLIILGIAVWGLWGWLR